MVPATDTPCTNQTKELTAFSVNATPEIGVGRPMLLVMMRMPVVAGALAGSIIEYVLGAILFARARARAG